MDCGDRCVDSIPTVLVPYKFVSSDAVTWLSEHAGLLELYYVPWYCALITTYYVERYTVVPLAVLLVSLRFGTMKNTVCSRVVNTQTLLHVQRTIVLQYQIVCTILDFWFNTTMT